MKQEIYPDSKIAYAKFASLLHTYFPILRIKEKHNGLHRLIETPSIDFYCVFKKEWFMTFNNHFPEFVFLHPEFKGVAETINFDVLLDLTNRKKETMLIFLHQNTNPEKKAEKYVVYPKQFYNFATKHKLIRKQEAVNSYNIQDYSGRKKYINETTIHLPLKKCFFHNFNEWILQNTIPH